MVLVGIVGAVAAIKTLRRIKRQAELMNRQTVLIGGQLNEMRASGEQMKEMLGHAETQAGHMERQARVMEDQAKVLINSERAWVLLRPDTTHELVAAQAGMIVPFNHFRVTMFNGGKTVARLKKLQASTLCLPEDGTQFPAVPTYTPAEDFPPEYCGVLAPNDEMPLKLAIHRHLDSAFIERIKNGQSRFFIFGRIEYYDFAEELRVRQFCFLYASEGDRFGEDNPVRWLKSGPVAYNSHT